MNPEPDKSIEVATEFFLAHSKRVRGVALRYAPSKDLVDDVVQQVYLEFVKKREQWNYDGDVAALLAVMARNFARRLWRDHLASLPETRRKIAEHLQRQAQLGDVDRYPDEVDCLKICMDSLSDESKDLLQRHYMERVSVKQLAEEQEKQEGAVRRALFRIRKKLRSCVQWTMKRSESDEHY